MRVLLVSEGKHELEGALETIVERLRNGDELEFVRERVAGGTVRRVHTKGRRYFKRMISWLKHAAEHRFEALIFVIDEDGDESRTAQARDAQEEQRWNVPRAFGVAIRKFDAWMLADEQALTATLGFTVERQRNPEIIPDPKQVCASLLDQSRNTLRQREMYAVVAQETNLTLLEERCPRGFRPFAERVRAMQLEGAA